jgi:hypothetical protein
LQFSNLRLLHFQPRRVEPVRLHRAAAVIGDANIFQAKFLRRCDHFLEGIVSIAGGGMAMKGPA